MGEEIEDIVEEKSEEQQQRQGVNDFGEFCLSYDSSILCNISLNLSIGSQRDQKPANKLFIDFLFFYII